MERRAQKAVLVLGMHRSGTSAFTRILNLLGLDLPTGLMPVSSENRQGHWESMELMHLHDEALARCNSWWGDWRSIPADWFDSDSCEGFGKRLTAILRRDFADSAMFVIKDPRMCRLAPLWLKTLAQLGIEPLVLITIRHPAEVGASLMVRNGFDESISNLLWLSYMLDAERYTRRFTRSVVTFDGLMNNWRSTVNKIGADLKIQWPISPESVTTEIDEFLSPDDRHHYANGNSAFSGLIAAAYQGILNEAEQDRKRWSPRRWDCLHGELERGTAMFSSVLAAKDRELDAARAQLQNADEITAQQSDKITDLENNLRSEARQSVLYRQEKNRLAQELEVHHHLEEVLRSSVSELEHVLEAKLAQLQAINASASFQLTLPVRRFAVKFPRAASQLKRLIRLVTLQSPRKRLRRNVTARLVSSSKFFDAKWYLTQYPDVRTANMSSAVHYLEHGASEGRDPGPFFDTDWYLQQYPDVLKTGVNPLVHYLQHGASEGRHPMGAGNSSQGVKTNITAARPSKGLWVAPSVDWYTTRAIARSGLFDSAWYLANNHDVVVSGLDPISHYIIHGAREMRDPSSLFSTRDYLAHNPDVAASGVNPLAHYALYGVHERRGGGVLPQQIKQADRARSKSIKETASARPSGLPAVLSVNVADALSNAQRWCTIDNPKVSILIVNWNATQLTLECIRQIWANTREVTYEIIVVDNGSDAQSIKPLKMLGSGTRLLELGTNRFFGEANNIAAEQAAGKYLCFLNNDAFVRPGWLVPLLDEFGTTPALGAVGPMFLFPDGTLQEAGGAIDERGYPTRFGRHLDPEIDEFNIPKFVDYVSGAALIVEKELFIVAGGFDLAYEPAYYEDTDLCFKLRALGRKIRYCPTSKVIHIEGSSANEDVAARERRKILGDLNRDKFVSRWGAFLKSRSEADLPKPCTTIVCNEARQVNTSEYPVAKTQGCAASIAIFTPFALTPGGGERYMLTLASVLGSKNRVIVVTPQAFSRLRLLSLGRELDLDLSQCELTTYDLFVKGPKPDFMFVLGNHIVPPVIGLGLHNFYQCQFPFPVDAQIMNASREFLANYRAIIVNSEFTKMHVARSLKMYGLPEVQISVINPPVPSIGGDASQKKNMILTVGRFFEGGHSKRHDVLIALFQKLQKRLQGEVELHIAGSSVPEPNQIEYLNRLHNMAQQFPIRFHVNPTPEVLRSLYRDAVLYWHGAGIGVDMDREPEKAEHFGISIVEAMSAQCVPLAFNAGGPREIIRHGVDGFLYDTPESLVKITTQLLESDAARRMEMGIAAGRKSTEYQIDRFASRVLDLVEAVDLPNRLNSREYRASTRVL